VRKFVAKNTQTYKLIQPYLNGMEHLLDDWCSYDIYMIMINNKCDEQEAKEIALNQWNYEIERWLIDPHDESLIGSLIHSKW
jgi:hypothetical protein